MTERLTNEEREALIAGGREGQLDSSEQAELALMADLLANPSTWAEPRAGLEDRIVDAVTGSERAAEPAVSAAGGVRSRRMPRRRRIQASIGAAAAAVAVILGAFIATSGGPTPQFTAELSATVLAPGARASVDINHNAAGFRVSLDAHGLPALTGGAYYEAWLKNRGNVLVPIGTFSSSNGQVTLWSGVSPRDFPSMSVTIEKSDNDQTSSGRKVLTGTVHAR